MAGGKGVKAGDAYVLLGLKYDKNALKELAKGEKLTAMGGVMTTVGQYATIAFSLLGAAIGIAANEAGKYDAEMQRLGMIYGQLAKSQLTWMNAMRVTSQRGMLQSLEMINMYGAVAKGLELNSDQAIIFSRAMSQVTSNFATFTKLPLKEAMLRIRSALAGSGEVLDIYGINVKQAALDQEMLRLGFKTTSQGASELEKTFARATIIMKALQSQGAINADEFMYTLPRAFDIAKGKLSDMLIELGTAFLPVAIRVTEVVGGLAGAVAFLGRTYKPVIGLVGSLALGLLGLLSTVGLLGLATTALGQGITAMQAAYTFWQQKNTIVNAQLFTQNILVGSLSTKLVRLAFSISTVVLVYVGLINAITEAADAESELGKFREYNKEHPAISWMETLHRWALKIKLVISEIDYAFMSLEAKVQAIFSNLNIVAFQGQLSKDTEEAEEKLDKMRDKMRAMRKEMKEISPESGGSYGMLKSREQELLDALEKQKKLVKDIADNGNAAQKIFVLPGQAQKLLILREKLLEVQKDLNEIHKHNPALASMQQELDVLQKQIDLRAIKLEELSDNPIDDGTASLEESQKIIELQKKMLALQKEMANYDNNSVRLENLKKEYEEVRKILDIQVRRVDQLRKSTRSTGNDATLKREEERLKVLANRERELYKDITKSKDEDERIKRLREESEILREQIKLQEEYTQALRNKSGEEVYADIRKRQRELVERRNRIFRETQKTQEGIDRRELARRNEDNNEFSKEGKDFLDMVKAFKASLAAGTVKIKTPTALEYGTKAAMEKVYGITTMEMQMIDETKKQTEEIKKQTRVIEETMGEPTNGYPTTPQAKPQYQGV